MKLRNLFLASLAVCTMASCSKDDDGISGPQEVDAYLSFASTADVMTKTSTDGGSDTGTGKEAKIQSLTAYVFDTSADNKYVISKHVSVKVGSTEGTENEDYTVDKNGSINSIRSIHVKVAKPSGSLSTSSTSFKVVLLANTEAFSVTNLADLKSRKTTDIKTFNSVAVGESYLPMHSVELTVTGLTPSSDAEHVLNWYKNSSFCVSGTDVSGVHSGEVPAGAAEVEMTRSIARVQLASLGADFQALQYKNTLVLAHRISIR